MTDGTVGIILPCYNEENWIAGAIDSVLAQSFESFELVIVDDGSEDATAEIVDRYDDGRIRYIQQENRGDAGARNRALDEITTDYVAFIDADDRWLPEKLERQLAYLEDGAYDAVHTNAVYIDDEGTEIGRHHESPPHDSEDRQELIEKLFLNNFVCTSSMVCRRVAIGEKRFDEDLHANSDHDMWLRIAGDHRIGYLPDPLVRYRFHEGNISKNYEALYEDRQTVARRAAEWYPFLKEVADRKLANIHLTYGINLALDGRPIEARSAFRRALGYDLWHWKVFPAYVLTLLDRRLLRRFSKAGTHYD